MGMRGATSVKHPVHVLLVLISVCLVLLFLFLSAPLGSITNRTASSIFVSSIGYHYDRSDSCDYGSGSWVLDTRRRQAFCSAGCAFHRNAWDCGNNKKLPEVEMTNCSAWARMEPHSFVRAIRGMRLSFIGESLNENVNESVSSWYSQCGRWQSSQVEKKKGMERGVFSILQCDCWVSSGCAYFKY